MNGSIKQLFTPNSPLALHWPMVTKVPLVKFAKHTPNQVSKLVPHDMQQKPIMVSRLLTK